jgi:hypothetical protein
VVDVIAFVVAEQLVRHLLVVPAMASATELLVQRLAQQHERHHQSSDDNLK